MPDKEEDDDKSELVTSIAITITDYINLAIVIFVATRESLSQTAKIFICLPFVKGLLESIIMVGMFMNPKAVKALKRLRRIAQYTDWKLKMLEKEEEHRKDMASRKPNGHRFGCVCSSCAPPKANGHHLLCQCMECKIVAPNLNWHLLDCKCHKCVTTTAPPKINWQPIGSTSAAAAWGPVGTTLDELPGTQHT
jgi:hypothetical protein